MTGKKFMFAVGVLLVGAGAGIAAENVRQSFQGAAPLEWSVRMADSEMARRGDSLAWKQGGRAKWDYTTGLFTLSLLKLNEQVPNTGYVAYAHQAIGSFLKEDDGIQGYKVEDYNIDNINPGKTVLALYKLSGDERYKKTADLLRNQLRTHPRTSEGGFWHKQRYPHQVWLDGIYMGSPFYAEYGKLFKDPGVFDDVARQIDIAARHTFDPRSELFYHGWDESRDQEWADKKTGTSPNFWGRALGWYAMALVDVLDFFPQDHPRRPEIIRLLNQVCGGVVRHQDPQTGLWWQVLDKGRKEGNYLEATASCMFAYTMAKGINRGYLPKSYVQPTVRAYEGILKNFIRKDTSGAISLTRCCSVAGLGYGRDGSYEYYLREPVVDNDLKGVGPFILAGIEMQQLAGLSMNLSAGSSTNSPALAAASGNSAPEWARVPEILARIQPPVFPNREFPVTKYGAVADGKTDCTLGFQRAVEACAAAGGGRVLVPAGEYLTGAIHLKSNVELHLEGGATLKFSTDPNTYLPLVFTRFEGMECYNYSPLIYAFEQENVAVTGEGMLDGQASDENWWVWKGKKQTSPGEPNQKAARDRLAKMVEEGTPVRERQFGPGSYLRPSFVEFYRCRNVLIEGVRIRRSPMWELHPTLCTNVTVRRVEISSHGPNNDGCNPESCRDVLIEDCTFDTGDDCIAIKSGRNNDGRRVGVPSENIIIRRCTMKDGHGGVVIGSEISGGCRNVFAEDCRMDSPNLDRALRLKSNAVRGGVIQDVFMRNIEVGQVADAVLQIDFLYEEGAKGAHKPVARNIVMENIRVIKTPRILNVAGFPGSEISGVRIYNSEFGEVTQSNKVVEADVKLVNCKIQQPVKQ